MRTCDSTMSWVQKLYNREWVFTPLSCNYRLIYCGDDSLKSNGQQEVTDSNRFVLSKYRFLIVFVCHLQYKILEMKTRRKILVWTGLCRIFSCFSFHRESSGTINTVVESMMSSFRHWLIAIKAIEMSALQSNLDTMPLRFYATLDTMPFLIVPTKFNKK